tara:strand:+ start:304 stop:504 length:201 start_codon:yes stop_codon:yes gene_type:complete
MKNKILTVISVIAVIIILFLVRNIYGDYNLEKTVTACILTQKQTSNSFNFEEAKQLCEDKIRKSKK